jgi:hypothetical protein
MSDVALDPNVDRDEAIIFVRETGDGRATDVSAVESEWERSLFPLRLVFDEDAELRRWQRGFVTCGAAEDVDARGRRIDRFESEILQAFFRYRVPTILHGPETARWSVRPAS